MRRIGDQEINNINRKNDPCFKETYFQNVVEQIQILVLVIHNLFVSDIKYASDP